MAADTEDFEMISLIPLLTKYKHDTTKDCIMLKIIRVLPPAVPSRQVKANSSTWEASGETLNNIDHEAMAVDPTLVLTIQVMLTDFGVAKQFDESTRLNSMCGTLEYMTPEIIQGRGHDKAADWWSVGILMYEMLSGKPSFRGGNRQKIQEKIVKDKIKLQGFLSSEAHSLLKGRFWIRIWKPREARFANDDIHEMITTGLTMAIREAILEVFRSIKTAMIEMFEKRYATVTEAATATTTLVVAAIGLQRRGMVQYQDF
ncbi:probable serine/threonine-protein kinase KIN1 homolog [Lactuca sativa]|uniref:probable serine/threonine-protein kinase KIN1 homolog n=1 Tax=Lactuca sativa TaxID=4236 RepID=UPI0022B076B5|nr:probable serine/threonine-protein kinase KIN1 homolog [Lactuca sativa]